MSEMRVRPLVLAVMLALASAVRGRDAKPPADMKPYTETIPGTSVTFDMVPLRRRHLPDGQPRRRGGPRRRRGPAARGHGRSVLDGQARGHLERIRQVLAGQRGRAGLVRRRDQGRGRRRPDPPHAALRRRVVRLRQGQAARDQRRPPRGHGVRALAVAEDGQGVPPAHRGGVGVRLPRRHRPPRIRSATIRPRSASTPGSPATPKASPIRSAARSPTPGAFSTCTATRANGCSTSIRRMPTRRERDSRPWRRWCCPPSGIYPHVVRGGSWDHDAPALRCAARLASRVEWNRRDPQRPAEHLVAHRRHLRGVPPGARARRTEGAGGAKITRNQGEP